MISSSFHPILSLIYVLRGYKNILEFNDTNI